MLGVRAGSPFSRSLAGVSDSLCALRASEPLYWLAWPLHAQLSGPLLRLELETSTATLDCTRRHPQRHLPWYSDFCYRLCQTGRTTTTTVCGAITTLAAPWTTRFDSIFARAREAGMARVAALSCACPLCAFSFMHSHLALRHEQRGRIVLRAPRENCATSPL